MRPTPYAPITREAARALHPAPGPDRDPATLDEDEPLATAEIVREAARDGGMIPCSPYGSSSEDVAPYALLLARVFADATGEPPTRRSVENDMSALVNGSDQVASTIAKHAADVGEDPIDWLDDEMWSMARAATYPEETGEDRYTVPVVVRARSRKDAWRAVADAIDVEAVDAAEAEFEAPADAIEGDAVSAPAIRAYAQMLRAEARDASDGAERARRNAAEAPDGSDHQQSEREAADLLASLGEVKRLIAADLSATVDAPRLEDDR